MSRAASRAVRPPRAASRYKTRPRPCNASAKGGKGGKGKNRQPGQGMVAKETSPVCKSKSRKRGWWSGHRFRPLRRLPKAQRGDYQDNSSEVKPSAPTPS